MYTKLQRLILDRFEDFKDIPIVYLSTKNAYSTAGILSPERASPFRKLSYVSVIISDILDRTVWRVRPYEYRTGMTDEFISKGLAALAEFIEEKGESLPFEKLYKLTEDIVSTAATFIDTRQPRRPLIGIVGEIYLRSHPDSNQDLIRLLEQFGGEVVDASIGEWINFITYDRSRKLRRELQLAWKEKHYTRVRETSRKLIGNEIEKNYQKWRQYQLYSRMLRHLDIHADHSIPTLKHRLAGDRLFNFTIGTEAVLSIGGALEYAHDGFNGIVNVFPFTCMPSTICSAVLKPLLHKMQIPYIDAPYDGAIQPNREVVLRTFLYQAKQHLQSRENGRKHRG
jgi:predicted nucleotide-binding protein (sugar kinase/HSP70/actin superfamily)